jgi:Sec-independent protein translocase protein TatA
MFNIGWGELLLIAVIVLFAFGPEDIPKIMYNLGRVMRRFRYMRYALSSQFEDFMQKAESQGRGKVDKLKPSLEVAADDEGDADQHLIEMLPQPKIIETVENDRPDTTTADRG